MRNVIGTLKLKVLIYVPICPWGVPTQHSFTWWNIFLHSPFKGPPLGLTPRQLSQGQLKNQMGYLEWELHEERAHSTLLKLLSQVKFPKLFIDCHNGTMVILQQCKWRQCFKERVRYLLLFLNSTKSTKERKNYCPLVCSTTLCLKNPLHKATQGVLQIPQHSFRNWVLQILLQEKPSACYQHERLCFCTARSQLKLLDDDLVQHCGS